MSEPKFQVGDSVQVSLGAPFLGTVLEVRNDEEEGTPYHYYIVSVPYEARPEKDKSLDSWAYREQFLSPPPRRDSH